MLDLRHNYYAFDPKLGESMMIDAQKCELRDCWTSFALHFARLLVTNFILTTR